LLLPAASTESTHEENCNARTHNTNVISHAPHVFLGVASPLTRLPRRFTQVEEWFKALGPVGREMYFKATIIDVRLSYLSSLDSYLWPPLSPLISSLSSRSDVSFCSGAVHRAQLCLCAFADYSPIVPAIMALYGAQCLRTPLAHGTL
jgi:hypothetical protein